ncbi:hypothetical protein ACSAZK_09060 [Methanosarcina sp. Mfa9]|uniref:hypothetical protein n=1 Tax=Methanosarcina sp. Mfa9 TaxID=3439063 RepID=UPI003F8685BF
MKYNPDPRKSRKRQAALTALLSILVLALLTVSPAGAAVSAWEISPENPVLGDTLRIKGTASPEEEIDVTVTFEQKAPVSGGKYEYILEDVEIPEGFDNTFTVRASGVEDLNVRVKILVWITISSEASGGDATVSQSRVPPGTYMIRIDGNAESGASTTDLKITARQRIKADSEGDFSYSYNTKAVPPGDFEIKVGGSTKTISLDSEPARVPTPALPAAQATPAAEPEPEASETREEPQEQEITPEESGEAGNLETHVPGYEAPKPAVPRETGFLLDKSYVLGGIGASVLALIIISKRNGKKGSSKTSPKEQRQPETDDPGK